jgi:peptide/nickel transport system substrate-binding protein
MGNYTMTKTRGLRALVSVGVAASVVAAGLLGASAASASTRPAAGSSFGAAITGIVNPSTKQGGTLHLNAIGDCDSWDPARTYYGYCWVLQRIFTRSLLAYPAVPGTRGAVPVPDLATALPKYSNGGKTVTVTLKSGIKYSTGAVIKAGDIKYAIERLYSDQITGGPVTYYQCLLDTCTADGTPQYKGPYTDKKNQPKIGGKPSILVSGNTITFHLKSAFSDFNNLLALSTSAPVPAAQDKGGNYTNAVVSSGPFKFKSYSPQTGVVWVRNPFFSQASDKVVHPHASQINLVFQSDPTITDAAILQGSVDYAVDGGVQTPTLAKVISNANLKKYADNPVTIFTRYISVMQAVAPLNNIHCRRAIFYAINKAALRTIRGGSYGGQIAGTMLNPSVPGANASYNPYPSGVGSQGNLPKAKAELAACGKPNGFYVNVAYVPNGRGVKIYEALQAALKRVGITTGSKQSDAAHFYSTFIGSPSNIKKQSLGLAVVGWGADFPSAYGFFQSIANGNAILPAGNSNYASLNDPKVNSLLNKFESLTNAKQQAATATAIDHQIMADAVYLPFQFDKSFYIRTPRLTNIYLQAALGSYYDTVNVGVQ